MLMFAFVAAGCGYTTRGLYSEDIQTVAVPIFTISSYRRNTEFLVTQKVIQAIEAKTPFKVVGEDAADTVLIGKITSLYKSSYGEDGFDNPRGGMLTMTVEVTWIDNRTGTLIDEEAPAGKPRTITLTANAAWTIDTAQSYATAENELADKIAAQVAQMMQAPW